MSDIKSFAVIGGDKRMIYCAEALNADGYTANTSAADDDSRAVQDKIISSDAIILPLPVSKDGKYLYAPLCREKIGLGTLMECHGKPVFCGSTEYLSGIKNLYCYGDRDDFKAANALPTAEGAIASAIMNHKGCITKSRILVTGFGKTGRVLSSMLRNMGAHVSVSARKSADIGMINALGMNAVYTDNITGRYDIIFNTVPAVVLGENELSTLSSGGIVIDIASMPGGVDTASAVKLGIKVYHELSIPGRTAPQYAGKIIKNTVLKVAEEEKL